VDAGFADRFKLGKKALKLEIKKIDKTRKQA
jgi:hypothetical protein